MWVDCWICIQGMLCDKDEQIQLKSLSGWRFAEKGEFVSLMKVLAFWNPEAPSRRQLYLYVVSFGK